MANNFAATICAQVVLPQGYAGVNGPAPGYASLTGEGVGESKPEARARAEQHLRKQLSEIRVASGPAVVRCTSRVMFSEVTDA